MQRRWAAILLATMAGLSSPSALAAPAKEKSPRQAPPSPAPRATPKAAASPKPKGSTAKREPSVAPASTPKPKPEVVQPPSEKPKQAPKEATVAAPKSDKPAANKAPAPPKTNEAIRRKIAGSGVEKDARPDGESAELRMLREIDLELFPARSREGLEGIELPAPLPPDPQKPKVHATGLPPVNVTPTIPLLEGERDLSWLRSLNLPDLPARWDARVIRYLEYYRDNPRGRMVASLAIKRSGRWIAAIRATLRSQGLPEDLVWASLVESAFDPTARSHAGAAGLWQFMPETARIYGLNVDSQLDERLDPRRATEAAARHLGDLYRRFGSWELALAAYNMGYGGLLAAVRKFNTNDYWELGRWESGIPWETTLYVPKIVAMAIVANNPAVFGLEGIEPEPALEVDPVPVPGGVTLKAIALSAGVPEKTLVSLNPQLRAGKTPVRAGSDEASKTIVYVPAGLGPTVAKKFGASPAYASALDRHVVRFGESLETIAEARGVSKARIVEMNGLREGETVRARGTLLVPAFESAKKLDLSQDEAKPVVIVPPMPFEHEGHRRVFYRVLSGDTLAEIASAFEVLPDDLRRWNALDPSARLHEGMTLQLFVPEEASLATVLCLEEAEARVLEVGSDEFFAHFEGLRGRKRAIVTVQPGDTWQKLGQRYGLSLGQLERINRRPRTDALIPGESVVVYAPIEKAVVEASAADDDTKAKSEPLPEIIPPKPEDLPEIPSTTEPTILAEPAKGGAGKTVRGIE